MYNEITKKVTYMYVCKDAEGVPKTSVRMAMRQLSYQQCDSFSYTYLTHCLNELRVSPPDRPFRPANGCLKNALRLRL